MVIVPCVLLTAGVPQFEILLSNFASRKSKPEIMVAHPCSIPALPYHRHISHPGLPDERPIPPIAHQAQF